MFIIEIYIKNKIKSIWHCRNNNKNQSRNRRNRGKIDILQHNYYKTQRFSSPRHRWPKPILAILYRLFGFLPLKNFYSFFAWLSNHFTLSLPDEGYLTLSLPDEGYFTLSLPNEGYFTLSLPDEGYFTLSLPDEGYFTSSLPDADYFRNASSVLNYISTFVLLSLGRYLCWWIIRTESITCPIVSVSALTWILTYIYYWNLHYRTLIM